MPNCRCQGQVHAVGTGMCDYGDMPPATVQAEAAVRAQNGEAWARVSAGLASMGVAYNPGPTVLQEALARPSDKEPTIADMILQGSDGIPENELREMQSSELSVVLRQAQRISEMQVEKAILERQRELLVRMVEELIEQDIPDVDPAYYRKRIARITDG